MIVNIKLLKITGVDIKKRTIEGFFIDGSGFMQNITVCTPPNDSSMPKVFNDFGDNGLGEGQLAVVIFDVKHRPYCIGFVEVNHQQKVEQYLRPDIKPGELYKSGPAGQEIFFRKNGDWHIKSVIDEGIEYKFTHGESIFKSKIFTFTSAGFELLLGFVRRLGRLFIDPILGPAIEFTVRLIRPLTKKVLVWLSFGDVSDENGIPVMGKLDKAIALIKLFSDAGINIHELVIDKKGNIHIKLPTLSTFDIDGDTMNLKMNKINLGSELATEKAILGSSFFQVFLTHTHSTAVGSTSPPVVAPPEITVLSDIVKIKSNFG